MDGASESQGLNDLSAAVRQLAATNEKIAQSLANLETLYSGQVRVYEELRKDYKERVKKWENQQKKVVWCQTLLIIAMFAGLVILFLNIRS
jgi:hypothetical protein